MMIMNNTDDKDNIALRKQILRKRMSIWRESLHPQDVQVQSAMMTDVLLRFVKVNEEYFKSRQKPYRPCIGLYNAFRNEADFSSAWIELQKAGWDLSFPIMINSPGQDTSAIRQLLFVKAPDIASDDPYLDEWFIEGHFGVKEPPELLDAVIEPNLIILPGLAFDRQGRRLGWGKAYYDSYLTGRAAKASAEYPITIGAVLEGQLVDEVPYAGHDVSVAGLITSNGIILTESCFVELFI